MEYIKKQNTSPNEWDLWFRKATGDRSFDYGADYPALTNIINARLFLIAEQSGLCAYCQQSISRDNSSIEHVIPKELNVELSTSYYNLVAVCKTQLKDPDTGRFHCDKEKGSKLITPLIFISNSAVSEGANNRYFSAYSDGKVDAKFSLPLETKAQIESFITVLNLNHKILKESRVKDVLDGLILVSRDIPAFRKNNYWRAQYNRILLDKTQPFRQFLLIYIGAKIGIS